ncbi:MAG: hypothetical protein RLZZ435_1765 [Cyanobacteriota bacterium]|jgi:hypothetical protein
MIKSQKIAEDSLIVIPGHASAIEDLFERSRGEI